MDENKVWSYNEKIGQLRGYFSSLPLPEAWEHSKTLIVAIPI